MYSGRTYCRGGPRADVRVEHAEIRAWLAELSGRRLSGAPVSKAHSVLSGILGLAVRDRRLPSKPALGVNRPPLREARRRYLTAAQAEALAVAAGRGRVAVLVLACCGLRWSELAALRVRHVDLMRRRLTIEEAANEINSGRIG